MNQLLFKKTPRDLTRRGRNSRIPIGKVNRRERNKRLDGNGRYR